MHRQICPEQQLMKKEAFNLKEGKEGEVGIFAGRKGEGRDVIMIRKIHISFNRTPQ